MRRDSANFRFDFTLRAAIALLRRAKVSYVIESGACHYLFGNGFL